MRVRKAQVRRRGSTVVQSLVAEAEAVINSLR
jgi:hypothetical protein